MAKYLVAIYRPNDYDHAKSSDEAMRRDIDTLNDEMVTAGIRIFVGGLRPTGNAQSIRIQTSGDLLSSTGLHLPDGGVCRWFLGARMCRRRRSFSMGT